jgi:hypothetical protein
MRKYLSKILNDTLETKNSKIINKIYVKDVNYYINKALKFNLSSLSDDSWKKVFKAKSIVIVPDFLDSDFIVKINDKVRSISDYSRRFIDSNDSIFEKDNIVYQKGDSVYNDHKKIYDLGKCLVLVRDDFDKGMIDIFNFELLFSKDERDFIYSRMEDLSTRISLKMKWRGFNAYINNDITVTRGFHADSYSYRVKAFIYLTDVLKPDDGPYTFVYRSIFSDLLKILNRGMGIFLYKGTESLFFNKNGVTPIYGKKGTLIISDQSEPHRGLPQTIGGSRVILVINAGV